MGCTSSKSSSSAKATGTGKGGTGGGVRSISRVWPKSGAGTGSDGSGGSSYDNHHQQQQPNKKKKDNHLLLAPSLPPPGTRYFSHQSQASTSLSAGGEGGGSANSKKRPSVITLVLYSDFTCPYCYLEFTRLRIALEKLSLKQRQQICIKHGPFQIDDTLPAEGVDKYDFLANIIPPAQLDPMIDALQTQFQSLNMEDMNPRGLLGNSAPAHRLQLWVEDTFPHQQNIAIELKDELFKIHCCYGQSMSDKHALLDAACNVGLEDQYEIIEQLISTTTIQTHPIIKDRYTQIHQQEMKYVKEELGITSVPALFVVVDTEDDTTTTTTTTTTTVRKKNKKTKKDVGVWSSSSKKKKSSSSSSSSSSCSSTPKTKCDNYYKKMKHFKEASEFQTPEEFKTLLLKNLITTVK